VLRFGTLVLAVGAAWTSPLASERQVLTFRTRAWLSFAPSTCRMPLGQTSGFSRAGPGGRDTPRFRHRLIRFRHFINGSLALASLNLACQDHVPAFPQRSQPSLLTTAARGGLRPAPDCRPRRALLHLSYSSAPLHAHGAFVTHAPVRPLPRASRWASVGLKSGHSITSSARARINGGIVRPSALAVLRLTTSSNVVGCWTGRSAGFSPFRILPA
jgi:hypothetical protein